MSPEENEKIVRAFMEEAFNRGDLDAVDRHLAADAIDHQEPPGTDFRAHLKQVITAMRTAFPDLHFEIHQMLAEGEIVAWRSTMTGTHRGPFQLGFSPRIPPTGRAVTVAHMHFVRLEDGQGKELWHVYDIAGLLRQLGAMPQPAGAPGQR